jgi:hypothetical protein
MTLTGRVVRVELSSPSPGVIATVVALGRWCRFDSGVTTPDALLRGVADVVELVPLRDRRAPSVDVRSTRWDELDVDRNDAGEVVALRVQLPSLWVDLVGVEPVPPHVRARRRVVLRWTWPGVVSVGHRDVDIATAAWAPAGSAYVDVVRALAAGTPVVSAEPFSGLPVVVGGWRDAVELADDPGLSARVAGVVAPALHREHGVGWRAAALVDAMGWTARPMAALERELAVLGPSTPTRVSARLRLALGDW